jgi:arsenite oxidase small subunit
VARRLQGSLLVHSGMGEKQMKRCDNLVDVGRRQFLSGAGAATAAVAAATLVTTEAKADTAAALVKYPSNRLASLAELKGFPLNYHASDKTMNCPGHYSRFDCEKGGQQVWGQATQNLPQYALRVDDKGDVYADGVDELLYGRLSNVL